MFQWIQNNYFKWDSEKCNLQNTSYSEVYLRISENLIESEKNRTKVVGLNIKDRVNFDYHTQKLRQKAKSYRHYQWYLNIWHCVKSAQIRSFFWSVFSRIRTEYGEIPRDTD